MSPSFRTPARFGIALGALTTALVGMPAHAGKERDPAGNAANRRAVFTSNGRDDSFLVAMQAADAGPAIGGDRLAAKTTLTAARQFGAAAAIPATGDPLKGVFSPAVDWPLIGIHAVLTPDGRVLTYGSDTNGIQTGQFVYDVWDPQLGLGSESHQVLPNTANVDVFCSAQLLLPSGDVALFGGDITESGKSTNVANADVTAFNPADNSLSWTGTMQRRRWYASAITMPSGEVYIQGGRDGQDYPEVRNADGSFRLLTGAWTGNLASGYPRNFVRRDGKIFGIANKAMYQVDPSGNGSIVSRGSFPTDNSSGTSTAVMIAPDRILQVGGGTRAYEASLNASVIDISAAQPQITALPPMSHRRHWANATVLADGRVFVSGGSATNNAATDVAYTSELYDPQSNSWTLGATATRMRLYHSASLLLPDATVLTLGGGAPGPQRNRNAEIYYPPYLFDADGEAAERPTIDSAPMTVDAGEELEIGTPDAASIARVTLVKTGSVTHSFNMDQRFIELPFSMSDDDELEAQLPAEAYKAPPGYYMVFVIDGAGVPSEAAMLRINPES